ncbi:zonadhesin-like [Anneissia japonica]|uniref:zonadhesin-like n=1 Tax=Anneissia japonica TaxID=1529436 RepID=UPI0014255159|nr:zonadhesin-like [Anneissia japonica]
MENAVQKLPANQAQSAALCFHEGTWRSEGDTWNQGRCDVCNCVDGVVTCNPMTCPQVQASAGCHVVQHNGFCCPVKVCRGSETQCVTPELTIANGENYTISNPLPAESGHTWSSPMTVTERAHCTCNMGRLTCTRSACPVAQDPCTTEPQAIGVQGCPSITCPYVKPGVCPIPRPGSVGTCDQQCTQDSDCQGATKCCSNGCGTACTNAWRAGCVDEVGTERTSGDVWYQDLCTICNCVNNQSICEEQQCAEVPPGCSIKLVAGQCCGEVVCQPSTTAQVATCDYEGQNYMPGNTWIVDDCTTCRCDNGRTVCDRQTCPKTSNYGCRMLYIPGKCCPEKICKEPKSCLYDGVYYLNSEKFYVSACEECECLNGVVTCKNETCPTPTGLCTYEVPVGVSAEFSCCMNITCPLTGPGQTCQYNGKVYNYNEVFMRDACTRCKCNAGEVTCTTTSCPQVNLEAGCRAVPVFGKCCPQITCRDVHSCIVAGVEHLNGEQWNKDKCTICRCDHGMTLCTKRTCPMPRPGCNYDLTSPSLNKCCGPIKCPNSPGYRKCTDETTTVRYNHGEVWMRDSCTQCQCRHGYTRCNVFTCPTHVPAGCRTLNIERQCCPHVLCDSVKVGQCPAHNPLMATVTVDMCGSDADCAGNSKCCNTQAARTCMSSVILERPGMCPTTQPTSSILRKTCVTECTADSECGQDWKCCSDGGCSRICRPPVSHTEPTDPMQPIVPQEPSPQIPDFNTKEGVCPKITITRWDQTICLAECSVDTDCIDTKKCCSSGCRRTCVMPLPTNTVKKGLCPIVQPRATCQSNVDICGVDNECTGNKKCCYNGCHMECMVPDAPVISCPVVAPTCNEVCTEGYATDPEGCEICSCARTCDPINAQTCSKECTFGYATDGRGCKICSCKNPSFPEQPAIKTTNGKPVYCEVLTSTTCLLNCVNGFKTDSSGCEICSCKQAPTACTPLTTCGLYCAYGLATNANGCEICQCKVPDMNKRYFNPIKTFCERPACYTQCPEGYATDSHGCDMRNCMCKRPVSDCPRMTPETCPERCPYGFATNTLGCEVCKCRLPVKCPDMSSCTETCIDTGFQTDNFGCKKCMCNPRPITQCPSLTIEACPIKDMCAYGLATDNLGCPTCICKLPEATCPPMTCDLRCEFGFSTDKSGCEICKCKQSGSTCPVITNFNCKKVCPFGLATCTTGCEICACKKPVSKTSNKFHSKNMYGATCDPVTPQNCALTCTDGYATDFGCEICQCRQPEANCPVLTDIACPRKLTCPYGLSSNSQGCPICECKQPISCSVNECTTECPYGYATDTKGCDICKCKLAPSATCKPMTIHNCQKMCSFGYATDVDGCETCACKQPSIKTGITVSGSPLCEPLPSCQITCTNGYATDNKGCEICSCKAPVSRCGAISYRICPQKTSCPFGLATNSDGCEICSCKIPATCPKVDRTNCDQRCDFGYATDTQGCEVCQCKTFNPRTCSLVHEFNCRIFCPYGLATNSLGCEVCKCKLPPGQETYTVVSLRPDSRCPKDALKTCALTCPNGYATSKGCEVCSCKETGPQCTAVTPEVCPKMLRCQFGLQTNDQGCEVCFCRLPALCKSLKTCKVQCENGFATDKYGCEICECKAIGPTCTPVTNCNIAQNCENGLATDPVTRCEICSCKMPRAPTFYNEPNAGSKNVLIPEVKTCSYSPHRSCSLVCSNGFATDYKGCEICMCKVIDNTVCPVITEVVCPIMRRCEYGLATNTDGCSICACKAPAMCKPVDASNCNLRCEYGYATDTYGCKTCACKSQSITCVPVTSVTCPLTCTLGLATDSNGCEICKCRMPCVVKTLSFQVPTDAQPNAVIPQSRWIPNLRCFNLNNCLRTCPYGYVTNTMGCEICQCRKPPSQCQTVSVTNCPIKETCPYGLRTDVDGCEICSCKQPTPCSSLPSTKCTTVCLNGFATDTAGCPDFRSCKCKRSASSRVCDSRREEIRNCKKSCAYGYASNTFGCPICKCQQPTSKELSNKVTVSRTVFTTPNRLPTTFYNGVNSVNSVNCPLVNTESCSLTCDYGYATDSTGCTTCKCRSNPATCLQITAEICPLVLTAKYGLATSATGCDMCLARRPMTCNPVNNQNCANNCLYGHATDNFGCEVCNMCAKPPGECIGIPSTCQKNCNYGYATDPQGCPMCLCRNPPSYKTSRIVNFKPTTTPKTPTVAAPAPTCPDLNCALSCSQGYATDPTTGCGLCKCSGLNCRERECAGKCPFGVVTNRKGCQTCTCKKPITCQPLSQCNLNCPRGYATNVHGCEVCLCKKNFDVCPEPMCEIDETLRCSFGYATDANGCEICQCKMPVISVIPINATPVKCTPLTGSTCSLSCPNGFATDTTGCETCLCIKPATECGIAVTDCSIASTCPYGLATDDLGCTVCKCKMPSLCQPLPSSCNENCEFGIATNRFGCEKCACKEYSPGDCPSLTTCTLNCPLGLASNNAGCEICKCKFPTSAMVTMVSELTPVQDPNLPTTAGVNVLAPASPCSPIQCFVHCPHGFVTDPVTGCEVCECQTAPRFTCPAVPRTTHSMCVDFCALDSDCPPNAFCCSNGCGKTCLAATSNECIDENGVSHASGKVWMRDSCTRCSCDQGVTSCSAFKCEPIPQGCQPFYITGQCCPSSNCPDKVCVNQGTWIEDTCTNCTCVDNAAVCTKQSCPEIKPGCTPEYVRGKCCPDMKCQGCRLGNGQSMRNGETWNKDKCTTCRCENGNSVCSSTTCEQPKPGCKVVSLVNQCCPRITCPAEGSSTSAATTVGEQPCYAHQKTVPSINFMGFSIPITGHFYPSCTSNGFYEGKQCHTSTGFCWCADPFGVEIPNTRTQHGGLVCEQSTCVDHLGKQRIHGDQWKPDTCTTCTCESGQNACMPVECPVVPQGCVITSTAGCCPEFTCGDGCTVNGIHYGVGRYWNADNCQRCTCQTGGQQQCVSRSCQVFSDPIPVGCQAVWTDDICCPRSIVCNGECPADKPRSTCIVNPCDTTQCPLNPNAVCRPHYCGGCNAVFYNVNNVPVKCTNCLSATGRMYLPGEDWVEGSCRLCACDMAGRSVCSNICQLPSTAANSQTCVDTSGQVYFAGQKWNNTQCQTCTCEANGQITCQARCSYSLTDPLPTGCSFIWTDDKCCPAQTVCNGRCPAGIETTPCFMNPCRSARCPLNRAARCRSNYCGGCNAVFVNEENVPVKCTECVSSWGREYTSGSMWIEDGCTECLCSRDGTKTCRAIQCPTTTDPIPNGCRLVPCTNGCCNLKVSCDCEVSTANVRRCDACATATCQSHPNAVCRTNTCNGCNAVFYDEFNKPVHCQYLSPLHNCPAGLAHMECFVNPCANAQCLAHPDALCRPNYCGTCHPEFFDANKQLVNCELQPECARSCMSNPCDTASCSDHPTAICRPNYCGGCVAEFFDENNRQVTCADCPPSKPKHWCFFNPCEGATCSNYPDALCRPNSCGGCHAEFYNINNQIVECAIAPVQQIMMTTSMPSQVSGNPCDPMAVKYLTDPIVTSFNPRCTSDGYFSPKQCDGQGACWCTDPTGQQVTRYTNSRAQALNLECAQRPCHQALLEAQTNLNLGVSATWIPDCDSDGSFEEEQCNDVECWCVEPDGAKIPYSMKVIGLELNCDDICFGQLPSSSAFCTMNDMCDASSFCHKLEGKRQGRCCKIPRN